jgi:hypothetical protein
MAFTTRPFPGGLSVESFRRRAATGRDRRPGLGATALIDEPPQSHEGDRNERDRPQQAEERSKEHPSRHHHVDLLIYYYYVVVVDEDERVKWNRP